METNGVVNGGNDLDKFKSYYVVWKQTISVTLILPELQFKSYYVVWKPT